MQSRTSLLNEINLFGNGAAGFLRKMNDFSTQMGQDLRARVDQSVIRDVTKTVRSSAPLSPELEYNPARATTEEADTLVRIAGAIADAVLGTDTTPSIAGRLPESWLTALRDAAHEIDRSSLAPDKKAAALRILVKDAVFLRFVAPELANRLTEPGHSGANRIFLAVVNQGSGAGKYSTEMHKAMQPLQQGFSPRLDNLVRELNLLGQDG